MLVICPDLLPQPASLGATIAAPATAPICLSASRLIIPFAMRGVYIIGRCGFLSFWSRCCCRPARAGWPRLRGAGRGGGGGGGGGGGRGPVGLRARRRRRARRDARVDPQPLLRSGRLPVRRGDVPHRGLPRRAVHRGVPAPLPRQARRAGHVL